MDSEEGRSTSEFVVVHLWRWVGRALVYVAETLASWPGGQRLLRQVDRVLEAMERSARALAGAVAFSIDLLSRPFLRPTGHSSDESGGTPRSFSRRRLRELVPMVIAVLPVLLLLFLILLLPIIPVVVPALIAGAFAGSLYERSNLNLGELLPTPGNVATWIWRWRRRLRRIRYDGVRRMRIEEIGDTHAGLSHDSISDPNLRLARRKRRDSEEEALRLAVAQSTSTILDDLPAAESFSDESPSSDEEEEIELLDANVQSPDASAGIDKGDTTLKNTSKTSELSVLLSDTLLSSDDDDEDYVPDTNEEEEEEEEEVEELEDDDAEDDDNERTEAAKKDDHKEKEGMQLKTDEQKKD